MESITEFHQRAKKSTQLPVIYTAVGWVAGIFQPGKKKFQGVLVTEDGQRIDAKLDWYLAHQIKKLQKREDTPKDWLQLVHRWKVYPCTEPLRFDLMQVRQIGGDALENKKRSSKNSPAFLDKFRVVGEIKEIFEKSVIVRVRRNSQLPLNGRQHNQSTFLKLKGRLPTAEKGEIWDLQVRRNSKVLAIAKGKIYVPSAEEEELFKKILSQSVNQSVVANSFPDEVATNIVEIDVDKTVTAQNQRPRAKREEVRQAQKEFESSQQTSPAIKETKQKKVTVANRGVNSPKVLAINTATPLQNQKSRFSVQVNGQVFIGFHSVTLNRRMLYVDGKTVAQAKLAVVLGQPQKMSADGSVTKGSNQAVLIGK
jgi:hypothetical protein